MNLSPKSAPRLRYLALISFWAVPQAALCALTFGESTIPGPVREGRQLPYGTFMAYVALILLLPLCTIALVPLLAVGRARSRGIRASGQRWATSWLAAVAAGSAVDALLWISVVGHLTQDSFGSWPATDRGALYLSAAFLSVGAAMSVLVTAMARTKPLALPDP